MKEFNLYREVFLLAILFAAAISDIRYRTVPNVLAAVSLPPGAAFCILTPQKPDLYDSAGLALFFLLLLFLWNRGTLGGGDVKLALIAALLTPQEDRLCLAALSLAADLAAGIFLRFLKRRTEFPLAPGVFLGAVLQLIISGGYL